MLKKDGKYYYNKSSDTTGKLIDLTKGKEKTDADGNVIKDAFGNAMHTGEYEGDYNDAVPTDGVPSKVCADCKARFAALENVLSTSHDYDFAAYQPYIASVTDHWYRDVYFIETSGKEFVTYDYDYEALTKERWTLYETYTDVMPSDPEKDYQYNPEKAGEFIIFEIDDNGEYKMNGDDYVLFNGTFEDARPSVLYYKLPGEPERNTGGIIEIGGKYYKEFSGDYDTATETLYRKNSDGNMVQFTGNVAVAKKAVTIGSTDTDALKDMGWEKTNGKWTAYKETYDTTESGYERLYGSYTDEEIKEEFGFEGHELDIAKNTYINLITNNNMFQVGEGQRTETNPKIKKMFLVNEYFRYDGSTQTAEIITALRDKIYSNRKAENSKAKKYGPLTEEEVNSTLEVTVGDETKTYDVADYTGNVSLNVDSLNAFSMLENTHTLDADYIYRDFKELVVELGYFEKEELTEQQPKVLQFPIPERGSASYPDRTIDKRENEFGTMIHSNYDIKTNNKYIEEHLLSVVGSEVSEETQEEMGQSNLGQNVSGINLTNSVGRVDSSRLSMTANSNINITGLVGTATTEKPPKKPSQVSLNDFLEQTREMCEYINQEGYDYCVNRRHDSCTTACPTCNGGSNCRADGGYACTAGECSCCSNVCNHKVHNNSCYLPTTFEQSQQSVGSHNFCCATLVSWALQNVGLMSEDMCEHGADNCATYCIDVLGGDIIDKDQPLKQGDIIFYQRGHVEICGEKKGGKFVKYNGGHYAMKGASEGGYNSCIEYIEGWPADATYAIRLNLGKNEDAKYNGYQGNEAVVSPVTGILLEYGTYNKEVDIDSVTNEPYRVNVDIKYGPALGNVVEETEEGVETEDIETEGTGTEGAEGTEETEEVELGPTVSDEVGYAKILVLNKEYYEILESNFKNKWKSEGNGGLLSENGVFKNDIYNEDDLEELLKRDDAGGVGDGFESESIYGYKEFAELYEQAGIAGYVIYMDGFKLELPDENFVDSNEDGNLDDEEGKPDGVDLSKETFNITNLKQENTKIKSMYEMADYYKVASQKETDRLNVEEKIKADAAPVIKAKDMIFIKEGTVIGRTYTNKEIVEDLRGETLEDYEAEEVDETIAVTPPVTADGTQEETQKPLDKLIGNYVRIIMRNLDDTVVENVEDYMKLDEETGGGNLGDIEQFMYWQAKEPEGFEYEINGVKSYCLGTYGGRRVNSSDAYGYDYAVHDGGAGDKNLCPGMWMDDDSNAVGIFREVTGQHNIEMNSTWCTGEQLIDIYTKVLEVEMDTIKTEYPNLASYDENDTRLFALMDVMYAGSGNFKIGTIDDGINEGRELTKQDFLSNCTSDNPFYNQNNKGFTRRRLCAWYMYSEGKYGYSVYDDDDITDIKQRYNFSTDTPFQDLMRDKDSAEIVDM